MSGGSHNYIYRELDDACQNRTGIIEFDDMIKDLIPVLHDMEWYHSGDSSYETYQKTWDKFSKKWFKTDRTTRLKEYIDNEIVELRQELLNMIGDK